MSNENCISMKTLTEELFIKVRFSETDPMGVVWHGNYLKFFEDAREFFGEKRGLQYTDVYANGFFTPIVRSEINHKAVIYYAQEVKVIIEQEYSNAAKIIFNYTVINITTNEIAATGKTIQVFMSEKDRNLFLTKPDFYESWENAQFWIEK